jgi:hypothetical protein
VRGKDDWAEARPCIAFMVCIDDSAWFLKVCLCSSRFPFLVIFGAFSWIFLEEVLGAFL